MMNTKATLVAMLHLLLLELEPLPFTQITRGKSRATEKGLDLALVMNDALDLDHAHDLEKQLLVPRLQ